jgi:hypothetical protein
VDRVLELTNLAYDANDSARHDNTRDPTTVADALRQVLQVLTPPPGNDGSRPTDATHHNLTTVLTSNGLQARAEVFSGLSRWA